jgi:hypothetical protein
MQPENQSFFQKNKKEVIIFIIITIFFLLIVGILFYLKNKKQAVEKLGTIPNQAESASLYSKRNNQDDIEGQNDDESNSDSNSVYYKEGLIKIWDRPVSGYGFYEKKDTSDIILVFVDSDTGFLYQKNLNQPTSTPIQITNSSYTNTRVAYFLNIDGGNKIILQYSSNNNIKSILADIPNYNSTPNELENATSLDNNITNISVSSDFDKAVYIVAKSKTTNNKKDVYSDWYLINDKGINKIYTSDLSSWKLQINDYGDIYAYNNETAVENNTLYLLNRNTLKTIHKGYTGSSYLINNDNILTSIFTNSGLNIYINKNFFGSHFEDNALSLLNFKTLTNKCYMGEMILCGVPKEIKNYASGLPDAWYQGLTSWQDNLYIINEDYPSGELLFDLNIDGGVVDVFDLKNIKVTKNENHALFINKNDGSLWSLNISNILNINTGD